MSTITRSHQGTKTKGTAPPPSRMNVHFIGDALRGTLTVRVARTLILYGTQLSVPSLHGSFNGPMKKHRRSSNEQQLGSFATSRKSKIYDQTTQRKKSQVMNRSIFPPSCVYLTPIMPTCEFTLFTGKISDDSELQRLTVSIILGHRHDTEQKLDKQYVVNWKG